MDEVVDHLISRLLSDDTIFWTAILPELNGKAQIDGCFDEAAEDYDKEESDILIPVFITCELRVENVVDNS